MTALSEYEKALHDCESIFCSLRAATLVKDAIESLKCCGNCGHERNGVCMELTQFQGPRDEVVLFVRGHNSCHFTPSRWQEREA